MLTHHGDEARVEIRATVLAALVVALDPNPGHLAAAQQIGTKTSSIGQDLSGLPIGPDRRNVVLCVARAHACCTTGAAREIDSHRPAAPRHAAPVIWIVHAFVFRARIALFALRVVRHR